MIFSLGGCLHFGETLGVLLLNKDNTFVCTVNLQLQQIILLNVEHRFTLPKYNMLCLKQLKNRNYDWCLKWSIESVLLNNFYWIGMWTSDHKVTIKSHLSNLEWNWNQLLNKKIKKYAFAENNTIPSQFYDLIDCYGTLKHPHFPYSAEKRVKIEKYPWLLIVRPDPIKPYFYCPLQFPPFSWFIETLEKSNFFVYRLFARDTACSYRNMSATALLALQIRLPFLEPVCNM